MWHLELGWHLELELGQGQCGTLNWVELGCTYWKPVLETVLFPVVCLGIPSEEPAPVLVPKHCEAQSLEHLEDD